MDMIKKTEEFLKDKFDNAIYLNKHLDAKEYRLQHSYRVANIGKQIAIKEDFNVTEMIIGCLLHDISYCEEFGEDGWKQHGRISARIARPFLKELGLSDNRINDICYGIAIHVDDEADFEGERTPFALTIGDSDNIDRFDVYRIHETLVNDDFINLIYEDKLVYVNNRLDRLKELINMPMATKTAEELWKQRIAFYIEFYEKLLNQLETSKSII